jgi:hypothetical protein
LAAAKAVAAQILQAQELGQAAACIRLHHRQTPKLAGFDLSLAKPFQAASGFAQEVEPKGVRHL